MATYGTLRLGEMQQMIAPKTGENTLIGDAESVTEEPRR